MVELTRSINPDDCPEPAPLFPCFELEVVASNGGEGDLGFHPVSQQTRCGAPLCEPDAGVVLVEGDVDRLERVIGRLVHLHSPMVSPPQRPNQRKVQQPAGLCRTWRVLLRELARERRWQGRSGVCLRVASGFVLQNRYGDTEYPIRDRWSSARIYRQALLRVRPSWAATRNLFWMAPAILLLAVLFISTDGFEHVPSGNRLGVLMLVEIGGFALLIAVGLIAATLVDRRKPRREQQQYWDMTGVTPVTGRRQQLLALDAQSDYGYGGWNSTLDYAPAWSRMPAAAQQRHREDPKWRPFYTMPLLETDQLRAQLDTQWHIASKADLQLFIADALSDRSLSAKYAQVAGGEQGDRMLARLSSLTGVNEWDLRALTVSINGEPARALWAADSQRVVSVIRMGYLADLIDTTTAWELIEHAAGPGTSLFISWDEFWGNVRVGLAFLTDSLETIQRFDHTLRELQASNWPAAYLPFPTSPIPAQLPLDPTPNNKPVSEG